jgi:3-dehydroquinate synthase
VKEIRQTFTIQFDYKVLFTESVFAPNNKVFENLFSGQENVSVGFVIDSEVDKLHPELEGQIKNYIDSRPHVFSKYASPVVIPGGEHCKNDPWILELVLEYIEQEKLDKHAYLIAIGGGAVLDLAGYAAAIAHRGLNHVRIPTTVLSQNDSGVGVKNGVNYFGKKNFLGTFAPPHAVINDIRFLDTLPNRESIAGMSEAVKVALLKDPKFFYWIEENASKLYQREEKALSKLIYDCAVLHVNHIGKNGDPFEKGSSRPLDFGHWSAHKLEQLTHFSIKHGEAVAIGLALDCLYSTKTGILDKTECDRILSTLESLGFELFHEQLLGQDAASVNPNLLEGLNEFQEHLGGQLTIMLINKIGSGIETHDMNPEIINECVMDLKSRATNEF